MSNIEGRHSIDFFLSKKNELSDSTLRNSTVRYSIFCGSLFNRGIEANSQITKKSCHFGVVSCGVSAVKFRLTGLGRFSDAVFEFRDHLGAQQQDNYRDLDAQ